MSADKYKRQAAEKALEFVDQGMRLGLGSGSTSLAFVELLAEKVRAGLDVLCVPTSESTRQHAERLGLRLVSLDDEPILDLVVDGADEIDAELRLIKGGGGALLREKIVACASERMLIIADHTKRVETLGKFPLAVEVAPFGHMATRHMMELLAGDAGCEGDIRLRAGDGGKPFRTDGGNYIYDCAFARIEDPEALEEALRLVPGVLENGLFLGLADAAIIAGPSGVEVLNAAFDDGDEEQA